MNKLIILKPFNIGHLNSTYLWMQDSDLRRNFLIRKNINPENHTDWFQNYSNDRTQKIFAIYYDDIHCGNCGLKYINLIDQKAELWIYIGNYDHRGMGVAKSATLQLIQFAFNQLNLNKIYLHVVEFNKAAINLYLNTGFKEEGVFQEEIFWEGKFFSLIRMRIFAEEFKILPYQ
jgi:diamine N-acetyltransferase